MRSTLKRKLQTARSARGVTRHRLDHQELALRPALVPFAFRSIDGVPLGHPVHLVEVAVLGPGAVAHVLGVVQDPPAPPIRRAVQRTRRGDAHLIVDRGEGRQRLGRVHEPHPPLGLPRPEPRRAAAVDLERAVEGPQAIAETLVDRGLRGPQDGNGLAPTAHVVELVAHEGPQHALAPVARLHADTGDARRAHLAAGDGEAKRVGRSGPDRRFAVERGDHAIRLDGSAPVLELSFGELIAEGDGDGRQEGADVVRGGRADRVAECLVHAAHGATPRRAPGARSRSGRSAPTDRDPAPSRGCPRWAILGA